MSEGGGLGSAMRATNGRLEQRLVHLLFARLSLTLLSFGIAIGLDGLGRELPLAARQGLYWTVAGAFATTIVSGFLLGRARHVRRIAALQIAIDVAIVTSLVHYSGGRESVFTFLYVVVTLYGAVLFERGGAMLAASLSSAAYGGLLIGAWAGWLPVVSTTGDVLPLPVLFAIWGVHVGALYLVGVLASLLSSELQRTGRALDQSTNDLRRLHDLYQRTVESIMSGLLTTDTDGRVTSFNPEAERITGVSARDATGQIVETLIPGVRAIVDGSAPVQRRTRLSRTRIPYTNADGDELFLGVAASVLRDADGDPLGHVVIFQDVTGVVEMERDLRSSERMAAVGEMAAKIAHEIRNPLASISGSTQILAASLEGRGGVESESHRLMEIVVRETDRLNKLITDFLQYSRPAPPSMKDVAITRLMRELVELLDSARPEDVRLEYECDGSLAVQADPDQIKQVLWNLCWNAVEAMPQGGVVRIGARHLAAEPPQAVASFGRNDGLEARTGDPGNRPWVEISIQDEGEGIPADVQERIFEPFFTTKRQGTGLGLATVHRIVESHGGGLLLSSEVGVGTTFRVLLPGSQERT